MINFIKNILSTIIGIIISIIIVVSIFALISIKNNDTKKDLDEPHTLIIKLDKLIQDRSFESPFNIDFLNQGTNSLSLNSLLEFIEKASKDPNINGIHLDFNNSGLNAGFASLEEIRNSLIKFKNSGKFINSYSKNYSQKEYYIASICDNIFLYPSGSISLTGLNSSILFLKKFLEKIGIQPQIIRHGKFKSAIEPLIKEEMSKESKKQNQRLINTIWKEIANEISISRNIPIKKFNSIINNFKIQSANDAISFDLVDSLFYKDELEKFYTIFFNKEKINEVNFISFKDYKKIPIKNLSKKYKKNKVAVIYAQGDITDGKGNFDQIGSESIVKDIRKAYKDEKTKAIVLRINSPGGSALASDVILRELNIAKRNKPLIVSFGDVAASGGYYIACNADKIFSSKNTITGSIGVFGVLMNLEKFNQNIGLSYDNVKTSKYSDFADPSRPLNEEEKIILQSQIERTYDLFLSHVSNGRDLSKNKVDEIGQGRVWSGVDALQNNLIDEFGGLNDAILEASKMSGLDEFRVWELPENKDKFLEVFTSFKTVLYSYFININSDYNLVNTIDKVNKLEKIQTRIPFDIILN